MLKPRYTLADPYAVDMIASLFLTPQGKVLKDVLTGIVETVRSPNIETSALHDFEGARRLASNLLNCQKQETIDSDDASPRSASRANARPSSRRRGPARQFSSSGGESA